jgi:RHS repeat-associated protein
VTNSVGSTTPYPEEDLDYYPYGGIVATSTDTVPQNYKFTGKERDAESGLDYFGARFNASAMGRFMSPDPSARGAELRDPQTWNCYAYVTNNPLKFNDPTGEARNPITNQEGLNPSPSSERGRINGTLHNPHKGEYGMVRTVSTANDKPHRGVDVLAPSGTPVHAPQDGTVVRITGNASDKCSTCFGLTIYVKTETGETVQFSHLSATAASLKPGSAVEAGQIIAASGTSGNAHDVSKEEQHLHVQVTDQSGHEINPVDYFNDPNTKPDFLDQNVNPPANTCTPDRCEHSSPPHAAPPSGK